MTAGIKLRNRVGFNINKRALKINHYLVTDPKPIIFARAKSPSSSKRISTIIACPDDRCSRVERMCNYQRQPRGWRQYGVRNQTRFEINRQSKLK